MQLNGKRSYGKIASLPPEVRNAVDNMILTCTVRLPEIQAYIEEQAGVDVSTSTISRYGKRLSETYRDLTIAQENFEALRKEVEKYPEQDSAEILTRIASHKMMAALVSKSDKDWNEMRADKLLKEISGLTRAMAYKQRVDIQNKDVVSAALDEVRISNPCAKKLQTTKPKPSRRKKMLPRSWRRISSIPGSMALYRRTTAAMLR